ncbi:chitin-binding protein [Grosmannia clavigera kw1407]|uniref:Chitin-binding protein n=1 Tax=Grosmannia clavigera (strain kw1407 / UAMH 11150) TaxID=655863 RepID=F0XBJ1_GROCL|nr:chitin-binding protein [Grosmannia clavigera kw1407]EFX05046.1 chitin-binding protein [Grosmannia clavigera kw1407]
MFSQLITVAAIFAAGASAHGRVTSPTPRPLGLNMEDACGQQLYIQMESDPNGNVQNMANNGKSQSDFNATACHLWQCRGFQFSDATSASIQSFTAGEVVPFTVDISAPHTGVANVSVINLAENSVIGSPLASWSVYASTATGVTANETSFSVTIPSDLPSVCSTSGGCALQWWWDARSVDQTYMNCVDFTIGSSGSTSNVAQSSSKASVSTSAAVAATAATTPASTSVSTTAAVTVAANAVSSATTSCPTDVTTTLTMTRSSSVCTPVTTTVTVTVQA